MKRRGRRLVLLILAYLGCAVVALAVLTAVKAVLNSFPGLRDVSPCPSSQEARRRGTWVRDVEVTPRRVVWRGQEIEVEDAWVEEVAYPDHALVWFPCYRKVGEKALCLRLARGHELFRAGKPIPTFSLEGRRSGFAIDFPGGGRPETFFYWSSFQADAAKGDDFSFPVRMGLKAAPLEPVDAYDITLTARDPAGRVGP
jgi:hypothetical protein